MTPQEYLKNELTILAGSFPQIHIQYGFDAMIDTHIVQLDPIKEYYENIALDDAWMPIAMSFDEQFEDCISFIPSDSSLKLAVSEIEWNKPVQALNHLEDYNEIVAKILTATNVQLTFGKTEVNWRPKTGLLEINDVDVHIKLTPDLTLKETPWFNFTNKPDLLPIFQKNTSSTQSEGFVTTAMAA
ncbi:MAG: hypothetical protein ABIX01_11130 [Chitinophagaceae bacterium]